MAMKYAVVHQAISALFNMVCITGRYWEGPAPAVDMVFQLEGWSGNECILLPQPTTWTITHVRVPFVVDAEYQQRLRIAWPFSSWVLMGDTGYLFHATLHNMPDRAALERYVAGEFERFAR